jgi:uncharacterized paraquat-inducible protein A
MRANALRDLADKYRILANSADSAGHFAMAALHSRTAEQCDKAAAEVEARYADSEPEPQPDMICDSCNAVGRHDGRNFVWTPPDPRVVTEHRATCPECHRAYVENRRRLWRASGRDRRQMPPEYQGK